MVVSIDEIITEVKFYKPNAKVNGIKRAYAFANARYKDRKRFSGEAYIDYLLDVVKVLLTMRPDEDTIVATLLQEVVKDKDEDVSFDKLQKRFGKKVVTLLAGLKKMKSVKPKLNDSQIETVRNMFLAMAQDLRVVLIKLAGRLVSMQTLQYLPVEKRKKIARETMDIYVPVSARLGVYTIKSQLEDLAFKYLYPDQYENIADQLLDFGARKGSVINEIKMQLESFLKEHNIDASVSGRLKSVSSIYRKLKKKNKTSVDEIFDVFAIRVVLPSEFEGDKEIYGHLYLLLGLIHSQWVPLANRFKDYVAIPKPNGYQSLHTTVLGLGERENSQPVEIQIRTDRMHKEAEYGVASHWLYENPDSESFDKDVFLQYVKKKEVFPDDVSEVRRYRRQIDWLHGLAKLQDDLMTNSDGADLKVDIFNDRIFVLTPLGEVKDLPAAATPIDFAYAVHTDVGHRCAMAKVNGSVVPLDYELKNGEVVEIILKSKPNPKPHWLSIVRTKQAKDKIKTWFRGLDSDKNIKDGKDLLNKHLRRYRKPLLDDAYSILKHYDGKRRTLRERENILEEIGNGAQLANIVVKKLFSSNELMGVLDSAKKNPKSLENTKKISSGEVLVGGEPGLPLRMASCCKPSEEDLIVAYVTRDHTITIHKDNCAYISKLNSSRLLEATWKSFIDKSEPKYKVKFIVEVVSRVGLLRDITSIIAFFEAHIIDLDLKASRGNILIRSFTLEVSNLDQFDKILDKIECVQNVLRVEKEL